VVNVVAASKSGFIEPDFAKAAKELVDDLARAVLQMNCNGVIWIRITSIDKGAGLGYVMYATGTAVRVA